MIKIKNFFDKVLIVFGVIALIFSVGFFIVILSVSSSENNSSNSNISQNNSTKVQESVTSNSNSLSQNSKITESTNEKIPRHRDTSLKGRGDDSKNREEPNYVNVIGYVVVDKYDFKFESMREMPPTPWLIEASYSKSNSDYTDEIAHQKLEHKTEVIVRGQSFKHLHHDVYEGRLRVERLSDGKEFFIDVRNFVTKPYWEDKNLLTIAEIGMYIAEDTRNGTKYLVFQRGTHNNYDGLAVGTWQEKEKYGKIYPQLVKEPMKPEFLKIIY